MGVQAYCTQMTMKTRQIRKRTTRIYEYPLVILSMLVARSPLAGAGRVLFAILRLIWRDRPVLSEHRDTAVEPLPTGPFEPTRQEQLGDLLIWVPRRIDSYLIDDLTGGYGYSHTTVDTGEIDVSTGKAIMAEITVGQTVERKFQDQYGRRAFARVPLARARVDVAQFVSCVMSKLGEQYDAWDAITLGAVDDPAREVCSGLVADCLPDKAIQRIAWARRLGLLPRRSVSVHSRLNALKVKAFVSPNGFAQYYGVPKGRKIKKPDTLAEPEPIDISMSQIARAAARRHGWKAGAGLLAAAAIGLVVWRHGGREMRSRAWKVEGRNP